MRTRVLILTTDSKICGTERMILSLLNHLDQERFYPYLIALKGPGDLIEAAKQIGVDGCNLGMDQNLFAGISAWWKILKQVQPDLLHSFLLHSNLLARFTRLMNRNLPVISGIRTVYTPQDYGKTYGRLERLTHWLDTFFVANSELGRQTAIQYFKIPPSKIHVIANGLEMNEDPVDPRHERQSVRMELGVNENDLVVGIIAQLRPPKRHDLLIRAIAQLKPKFPTIKLLVVGQGTIQNDLQQLASNENIVDSVIFTGYRDDARRLLHGMDLFALPSEVEGQPVSILESMDASLPVVVARTGGIPDIVIDGETGLICEPGNLESLTSKIEMILTDSSLQKNMGNAGKKRVKEEFTARKMAERFETLYQNCLD
jgi:glycosyltransferase involved in cell wall biosynthesis